MRISEVDASLDRSPRGPSWKAGGFPFVIEDSGISVCLVTSTNPDFGGSDPMIPKGRADFGEQPEITATREVYEETGIASNHIKRTLHIATETVTGLQRSYEMHVYAFELDQKVPPTANRECVGKWYTLEQASAVIRRSHKSLLDQFIQKIQNETSRTA